MFEFINYGVDKIIVLILIIARASGLFITAPILGDRGIPTLIRVGLLILLSLVLLPVIPNLDSIPRVQSLWQLLGMVLNEILLGFIIGFFFRLIFIAVLSAGSIIGYQIGFMIVSVFDTNMSDQVSIIGRFWYVLATLFFLSVNGHHMIINAFAESYQVIPLAAASVTGSIAEEIIKYSAYIFVIAIKIASPIMITLFLTDVALGTIAKTIPTMNVFFVGFPIKIGAGLLVMAMSLPLFTYVMERALEYFDSELRVLLYAIGKA